MEEAGYTASALATGECLPKILPSTDSLSLSVGAMTPRAQAALGMRGVNRKVKSLDVIEGSVRIGRQKSSGAVVDFDVCCSLRREYAFPCPQQPILSRR